MSQAIRPDTMIPTRRRFLAAVSAGAAVTASNRLSAAPPQTDAELLGLKAEFDPLFDLWRAMTIEQRADVEEFEARHKHIPG
jgi:hypothetical protein